MESGFIRTAAFIGFAFLCWVLSDTIGVRAAARRITIRTEDGITLSGMYYEASRPSASSGRLEPAGGRRPGPGIVLLHMLGRTHEDWDRAGSRLADAGFAVVAIDFRGHGASGGQASEVAAMGLDVRAAKGFLRERPEVAGTILGEAGASIGANLAVLDAADDPGVRSIALLSPGLDYRGLRIEPAMKKFGPRAALLVSSTKDPYSWRSVRQLALIGPGSREVRLSESIAHGTTLLSRDGDLISALVDWFRRTLI